MIINEARRGDRESNLSDAERESVRFALEKMNEVRKK